MAAMVGQYGAADLTDDRYAYLDAVEAWLAGIDPAEELLGVQVIDGLRAAIDGTQA